MLLRRILLGCFLGIVSGCAGELENPERFDSTDAQVDVCESIDVVTDILGSDTCSNAGCHDADNPSAGLDLLSPGLAQRLVNVASQGCSDRVLVDMAAPQASYLLESLKPAPGCGSQMPFGRPALSGEEIECVRLWIEEL